MRGIKSLLTIAILAGAGAAHASTIATFNVSEAGSSLYTSQLLTGTAVLDSSGTLTTTLTGTISGIGLLSGLGVADVTTSSVFTGTIAGNVFTATSGTSTILTCLNNVTACSNIATGTLTPLTTVSGSISSAGGGSLVSTVTASGITLSATDTFTPVAAVPVPAAAWLFGSGLLGLAGITRRRT